MKKTIAMLTVLACICSAVTGAGFSASAMEACTNAERSEQWKAQSEHEFPDPDSQYAWVNEGDYAFRIYEDFAVLAECKNREITEAEIPASVRDVPVVGVVETPFGFCRNLTTIKLPATMEHFEWVDLVTTTTVRLGSKEEPLPSVAKVEIAEENPFYTVSDGIVYSKDMKTLIGCPPAMELKKPVFPEKTEIINDNAFATCMYLEEVVIPDTIQHIHNGAFAVCPNLVSATFPAHLTRLSGEMFFECQSLSEVSLSDQLEIIGYGAFYHCPALKKFTIPENVHYIGAHAFEGAGCTETDNGVQYLQNWAVDSDEDLTQAVVRDGTIGIAEMAFFSRNQVSYYDFPASVKYIGDLCMFSFSTGVPSVLSYHCGSIGEKTIAAAKTTTDIYIFDPDCEIADTETTISAEYRYQQLADEDSDESQTPEPTTISFYDKITNYFEDTKPLPRLTAADNDITVIDIPKYESVRGNVTIHGYAGSTAQAYAEKYNRQFVVIPEAPLTGDVNNDGKLSIADAVQLQKWLLTIPEAYIIDPKTADLNEDNVINAADLTLLKQKILNL